MVLAVKGNSSKADFSAALNMVLSDGWVLTNSNGNFDPNARGAHTHHITILDAEVTRLTNGFQVLVRPRLRSMEPSLRRFHHRP